MNYFSASQRYFLVAFVLSLTCPTGGRAQSVFDFSGRIYADYSYTLQSDDADSKGENGFGYRRMYFTADFNQSKSVDGRFRLEASDSQTTDQGRPAPFVKDLFLRWKNALGEGHDVIAGVTSPPSWEVSEKVWGYRSLTKSLQDRGKILSSRDMGIGVRGPLLADGSIRYGVMVANNEGVEREVDKHKRIYGQIEVYPREGVSFTLGSDFASFEDGSALNVNLFGGYTNDRIRFGMEGYLNPKTFDDMDDRLIRSGVSAFLIAILSDKSSGIVRVDRLTNDFMGGSSTETMILAGFGIRTSEGVEIIPNVIVVDDDTSADATVTGRVTLYVDIG